MACSKFLLFVLAGIFCISSTDALADRTDTHNKRIVEQDFAFGRTINISGNSPLYIFEIPEDVYRVATRVDLGDVRIFNSEGVNVPYEISKPNSLIQNMRTKAAVPFFPIEGNGSSTDESQSVEVSEDSTGKVMKVRFQGKGSVAPDSSLSYLLDLRAFDKSLISLDINFQTSSYNQISSVSLEMSQDLKVWTPVSSTGVLAKMSYRGDEIAQTKIECRIIRAKFVRLLVKNISGLSIEGITGEFSEDARTSVPIRRMTLNGTESPKGLDEKKESIVFDSGGVFPVTEFNVNFPQPNTLMRLSVSSSNSLIGPWFRHVGTTFYRINAKSGNIETPRQIVFPETSSRFWKVEVEGKDSHFGIAPPTLELGWAPHQLSFLAQGNGPFKLVYGSAVAGAPDFGLQGVTGVELSRNITAEIAQLGEPQEIGGMSKRNMPAVPVELPWKTWLLWALLLIFLGVVAGMALSLKKDLGK